MDDGWVDGWIVGKTSYLQNCQTSLCAIPVLNNLIIYIFLFVYISNFSHTVAVV